MLQADHSACLQSAVYLARSSKGGAGRKADPRALHAPARRLARTTVSLGAEDGIIFGLRALRYSGLMRPQVVRVSATSGV